MPIKLDEIDEALIRLLRKDGRMGNRALAQAMGVAEGTVRARIRRLSERRLMRVVAITDTEAAGYAFFVLLWMQIEGRPVKEIARDVAALSAVTSVSIVTGGYDLFVCMVARDKADMLRLIADELGQIDGITRVDSSLALDVLHANLDWGLFRE